MKNILQFAVCTIMCMHIASLECAITMPTRATLGQRLHRDEFTYFFERTKLPDYLCGQQMEPIGVYTAIATVFLDLSEELDANTVNIMWRRKDYLLHTLLEDSPKALEDLARLGLYAPSPVNPDRRQRKSRCEVATRCCSRLAGYLRSFCFYNGHRPDHA